MKKLPIPRNSSGILEEGIESCGNKKIQKLSREMKELLEDQTRTAGRSPCTIGGFRQNTTGV